MLRNGLETIPMQTHLNSIFLTRAAREQAVKNADIVVSMLPARFHIEVAKDCLTFGKHLVTASYVSDEMKALDAASES